MGLQDQVILEAEEWNGYLEKTSPAQLDSKTANAGNGNYTIFAARYKALWGDDFQAQPWCAVFVSCALYAACGTTAVPHFASCAVGIQGFVRRGAWFKSNPQRGDMIFFADKSGKPVHVGLVTDTSARTVSTIEGNTSGASGVVPNGGGVCKKSYARDEARILGYGRPNYTDYMQKEQDDMTKDEVLAIIRDYEAKKRWATVGNLPSAFQPEVQALVDAGALVGKPTVGIDLTEDMTRALIISKRYIDKKQK